jgi:hypothetical protein
MKSKNIAFRCKRERNFTITFMEILEGNKPKLRKVTRQFNKVPKEQKTNFFFFEILVNKRLIIPQQEKLVIKK